MPARLVIIILVAGLAAVPAGSETLVAARTIRANTILAAGDVTLVAGTVPGGAIRPEAVIGMETRVVIYQGRPVLSADLGPPALVERNQSVTLTYRSGDLVISAEGRALGRGGPGERIRIMNIASRTTVTGIVGTDGTVHVSPDH
ncbi:MAG: flagellar basal body P-ring formation protein FlgA [Rhodobacteraceae bacterium]|nr:flagellar basal body P-ring formation protein FlgA [Paracoccaceae bacterium]